MIEEKLKRQEHQARAYNSSRHKLFWRLTVVKNIEDKILQKHRGYLLKKNITNLIELFRRIGIRYENLAFVFLGLYDVKRHQKALGDLFDPSHAQREQLQRALRNTIIELDHLRATKIGNLSFDEAGQLEDQINQLKEEKAGLESAIAAIPVRNAIPSDVRNWVSQEDLIRRGFLREKPKAKGDAVTFYELTDAVLRLQEEIRGLNIQT